MAESAKNGFNLAEVLSKHKLEEFIPLLEENNIDEESFLELTPLDIKSLFPQIKLPKRKKLMKAIQDLSSASKTRGTIHPRKDFDAGWGAERLKKAMRGIGSDEKMIIKVLTMHDSLQRAEIEQKYKNKYGQDLVDDLKSELGGHFEDSVISLLTSKYDLLVQALNKSFNLIGSDPQTLMEILCCRTADEIDSLNWWYESSFNESLESALQSHTSGDFRRLMISMVNGARPQDHECDEDEAKSDAQKLYDAGVGYKSGTDEEDFIEVLNTRCFKQLEKVFEEYEKIADEPIETSLNSEFSGDIRDGLLAVAKRVKDPPGFYAERLNSSMRGAGTDDKTLIRIIISRSESDLEDIKARYSEMYGNSLASDVKDDTSGDYQKILLAIINNKPPS